MVQSLHCRLTHRAVLPGQSMFGTEITSAPSSIGMLTSAFCKIITCTEVHPCWSSFTRSYQVTQVWDLRVLKPQWSQTEPENVPQNWYVELYSSHKMLNLHGGLNWKSLFSWLTDHVTNCPRDWLFWEFSRLQFLFKMFLWILILYVMYSIPSDVY